MKLLWLSNFLHPYKAFYDYLTVQKNLTFLRKLLSDPIINGDYKVINLEDLNLWTEESRDIIEFIAQKRGISTKELFSTIKPNPKRKNNQTLTPEKPLKNLKRKNNQILTPKNNQSQKTMFNNKERIDIIREELKELAYKLSKSKSKEIKRRLYMVENKKSLLNSKKKTERIWMN